MGSSAKRKKEKKKDFQKPKLKVGKARPKNTNATDTSFTAKAIIIKQQSLSESGRDASKTFHHNVSLLSSKTEAQRRDALAYLTTFVADGKASLPLPASAVLSKAQPLVLDGSSSVRTQLLRLVRVLPVDQLGPLDQILLYVRAGLTHLSTDIRLSALDFLDWLLDVQGEVVVSSAGGWIRLLRTFQNLLSWALSSSVIQSGAADGQWSTAKPSSSSLGSSKLLVHQLTTLGGLLTVGLRSKSMPSLGDLGQASSFPLWHCEAHGLPLRSNVYGYLNLFGASRDLESEMYDSIEERKDSFIESGMRDAFAVGVEGVKKEGGEVGRAAASVAKGLKLADAG